MKIVRLSVIIILMAFCLIMFGCNNKDNSDNMVITFENFEIIDENTYNFKVDNSVSSINLNNYIKVTKNCSWELYTSENPNELIPSRIAQLSIGDNTYYIRYNRKDYDAEIFTICIRRLPLYTVEYRCAFGGGTHEEKVQEGDLASNYEHIHEGYGNTTWFWENRNQGIPYRLEEYDFSQPITSNFNLYAQHDPIVYNITYVLNGGKNSIFNPHTYTVRDHISLVPAAFENEEISRWYEDPSFTKRITKIENRTGDITLYARAGYTNDDLYTLTSYPHMPNGYLFEPNINFINEFHISEITIPEGATIVDSSLFYCPSITKISIPNSVCDIYRENYYLYSDYNKEYPIFVKKDGLVYASSSTNPYWAVVSIDPDCSNQSTFQIEDGCQLIASLKDYQKTIGIGAIPNSVTSICSWAFSFTKLYSLYIPNSVTYIGQNILGYGYSSDESVLNNLTFANKVWNTYSYTIDNQIESIDITDYTKEQLLEFLSIHSCIIKDSN